MLDTGSVVAGNSEAASLLQLMSQGFNSLLPKSQSPLPGKRCKAENVTFVNAVTFQEFVADQTKDHKFGEFALNHAVFVCTHMQTESHVQSATSAMMMHGCSKLLVVSMCGCLLLTAFSAVSYTYNDKLLLQKALLQQGPKNLFCFRAASDLAGFPSKLVKLYDQVEALPGPYLLISYLPSVNSRQLRFIIAGMLSLPLLSTQALHPSSSLKARAGQVLSYLRPALKGSSKQPLQASEEEDEWLLDRTLYGIPCLIQQSLGLLKDLWQCSSTLQQQPPKKKSNSQASARAVSQGVGTLPLSWLGQFQTALQKIRATGDSRAEDGSMPLSHQQDEVMRMILTALLDHPDSEDQAAAASACAEAVGAFPLCGISFLPLLVFKLQSSVALSQQGTVI